MAMNLATMVHESARSGGDKPAILHDGGRVTYRELDDLSDRVAVGLQAADLGRGDRVALQLPTIPEFIVAYLGILKNGSVVVPLNFLLKAHELEYHLADSGASALITWSRVAAEAGRGAAAAGVDRIYAVGPGAAAGRPFEQLLATAVPGQGPLVQTDPGDTAVIIYTSGTTGRPKGAELTHFQMYMNADTPPRIFGLLPDDVVLITLPLFHVFGLESQVNCCLRFAATMSLLPRFDPLRTFEAIQRDRVTIFEGVHTMYIELLNHPDAGKFDLRSLRVGISGGSSMPPEVLESFERKFGIAILECYGMTETASTITQNVSAQDRKIHSVGKPIWGVDVAVWNDQHRPLPPGAGHVGEIVVRGVNTMRGYHNRPQATAESFCDGWFLTGDLGYLDEDGFLFIVDRKKDLINRGGEKVYPREVEEVLHSHPDVAVAAVLGVPHERLGEEVRAYVALKAGSLATEEELIAFAKERMAPYKYPRSIELRPSLPKLATGKVDKEALRAETRTGN
jgi:long-chain acyl-CoA synthetase